ncbi:PF20097 family protein [Halobacillus salinarum]|uniref:PF20097 family protein n=1 Tax=Halobacillus salinarum TaxID=2932257 RepID=A0ABY4ELI1_9BACI|nr:PF20097 family protein [Halobacillus salinarum]UOQ44877.1 PF20097 family protein [Halobacillus salinarum]
MKMDDIVSCPECGNDLKKGYIFSPRRICWSDSPDSILADFGSETLIGDAWLKVKKVPALRCEECSVVIFKHKENKDIN